MDAARQANLHPLPLHLSFVSSCCMGYQRTVRLKNDRVDHKLTCHGMLLNLNLCFGPPMISGSGPTCVVRIEEATHGAHVSGPRGLQRICRNGYQEPCGSTHKARQTGFEASISSFTHTHACARSTQRSCTLTNMAYTHAHANARIITTFL